MHTKEHTAPTTFQKVLKLWYIIFFGFFILFAPFGIFYIAKVTKNKKWMEVFKKTFLIYIVGFISGVLGFVPGAVIILFVWIFSLSYLFSTAKEFLRLSYDPAPSIQTTPHTTTNPNAKTSEEMGTNLIINLNKWKKEIESAQIQNDIDELINLSKIVMQRDCEESKKFFSRYSDTLNNMLSKYDEIENTRINSPEMIRSMTLIEKSITDIVVAFRNEINKMYKSDLLNLNAETQVFMQDLRNKGLIE